MNEWINQWINQSIHRPLKQIPKTFGVLVRNFDTRPNMVILGIFPFRDSPRRANGYWLVCWVETRKRSIFFFLFPFLRRIYWFVRVEYSIFEFQKLQPFQFHFFVSRWFRVVSVCLWLFFLSFTPSFFLSFLPFCFDYYNYYCCCLLLPPFTSCLCFSAWNSMSNSWAR